MMALVGLRIYHSYYLAWRRTVNYALILGKQLRSEDESPNENSVSFGTKSAINSLISEVTTLVRLVKKCMAQQSRASQPFPS